MESILMKLMSKSITEGQLKHDKYAHERLNRRLDSTTSRKDFMSTFMENYVNFEVMSRKEILSTFNFVIVGGGETCATILTGIFCHLRLNEPVRSRLCEEVRARFEKEDDITIDAIKELPYLEAVSSEGLCMRNPIPFGLPRVAAKGSDTYCGVYLPEGTRIGTRTLAVNRAKEYFHNPDSFIPKRWLPIEE
ncbi:cytochrome P450 [Delitschia confertaspora ATCC 74209]|uniref:Cytochrome P450 n=1 Tax=Delitschia confertaspora ATCC 74209 TaxID=1513339 RepID=A0A9P4JAT4_9PLEO|nr:cytochrome P450 [Delitschia confertaspora ATCC 74209]